MRLWLADGRLRGRNHKTFSDYKDVKTRFRHIQRNESETYSNKVFEDLDMAAGLDYRLFWRQLRKLKGKPRSACSKLVYDNTTYDTTNGIANGFSTFFEHIFNDESSSSSNIDDENIRFKQLVQNKVLQTSSGVYRNETLEHAISLKEISDAIKTLKLRKTLGWDNIQN